MKCDHCDKADFKVVKGWESSKALQCPKCEQYYYYVGSILCAYWKEEFVDVKKIKESLRSGYVI